MCIHRVVLFSPNHNVDSVPACGIGLKDPPPISVPRSSSAVKILLLEILGFGIFELLGSFYISRNMQ